MTVIKLDAKEIDAITKIETSIKEMHDAYMPLVISGVDDRSGFDAVYAARQDVKKKRIAVEKTRKELKAEAWQFGKKVDTEAKRITELLTPIESHLQTQEDEYNRQREAIRKAAEEAANAKLQQRVDALASVQSSCPLHELRAMQDDHFANLLAEKTAEHTAKIAVEEQQRIAREKLEAEERAERERLVKIEAERQAAESQRLAEEAEKLAVERRKQEEVARAEQERFEAERAEWRKRQIEEQQRIEEEKRQVAAAKAEAERLEFERVTRERLERESAERVEQEKQKAIELQRQQEAERARLEAMRPDVDKAIAYANAVAAAAVPIVSSGDLQKTIDGFARDTVNAANSFVVMIKERFV